MSNFTRKISARDQHQLIQIYLNMGSAIAAEMSVEYGASSRYARNSADVLGFKSPRKYRGSGNPTPRVNHSDHRWAWAVERGLVIK